MLEQTEGHLSQERCEAVHDRARVSEALAEIFDPGVFLALLTENSCEFQVHVHLHLRGHLIPGDTCLSSRGEVFTSKIPQFPVIT